MFIQTTNPQEAESKLMETIREHLQRKIDDFEEEKAVFAEAAQEDPIHAFELRGEMIIKMQTRAKLAQQTLGFVENALREDRTQEEAQVVLEALEAIREKFIERLLRGDFDYRSSSSASNLAHLVAGKTLAEFIHDGFDGLKGYIAYTKSYLNSKKAA